MTLDRNYFVAIQQLQIDKIKSEFESILSCKIGTIKFLFELFLNELFGLNHWMEAV